MSTYVARSTKYARDVVGGNVIACKWVKAACARQLADLEKKDWGYRFDEVRASKVCAFIECLPHIKGKWGGTPIRLEDWQCFILTTVFGWVWKDNGKRRFRSVYTEIARKNAKSTLSSGVGLYLLTADNEPGAEVYSAATTRDQARIVFEDAQRMARRTSSLREHYSLQVNAHNINVLKTASKFEALSAEGDTLDGLNIHGAIIDELHAHKTRSVWDVIETATGSREQSLLWAITTAGSNKTGICYEQRTYVSKILDRVFEDDTYFGIIYTLDEGDDWQDESVWTKANPNLDISVHRDDLHRLVEKAKQTPAAVNNVLTKRFNVWCDANEALFDMLAWDRAKDPALKPEDFTDAPCWIGIDLGFVDDIAAVVKVFERDEKLYIFGRYYLPEETVQDSRNSQYSGWARMHRIITTDGNVTDEDRIIDDLLDDCERYQVREIAFDPWNELKITNPLQKRGIDPDRLVKFPQTVAAMSPATEEMIKAVRAESIAHDGCPVLTWAMSNVVGHYDVKGNVYPRKERPENKIDPAIAAIMAAGRARLKLGPTSPYDERGVLAF